MKPDKEFFGNLRKMLEGLDPQSRMAALAGVFRELANLMDLMKDDKEVCDEFSKSIMEGIRRMESDEEA